jgi:hypothetical protein
MVDSSGSDAPRTAFRLVIAMVGMIAIPAALTLHTVRAPADVHSPAANLSPYGYTVSLLLFIVPIVAIGLWLVPQEGVKISKRAFVRTIALLFPVGAALDFCFARHRTRPGRWSAGRRVCLLSHGIRRRAAAVYLAR